MCANADRRRFQALWKGTENAGKREQTQTNAEKRELSQNQRTLSFLSLLLGNSLFFPCEQLLVFLSSFLFVSRDFRGSVLIRNPCFFGGFPCLSPKNKSPFCWTKFPKKDAISETKLQNKDANFEMKFPKNYQGQTPAQGILRLRNPNLGPNSVKRILDARIVDSNSWVEFFDSVSFQQ